MGGQGGRGHGVQEGIVGCVGHGGVSVAVQWEWTGGELHPRVAHLQEVVGGEGLVAARFGHLEALHGGERRKEQV